MKESTKKRIAREWLYLLGCLVAGILLALAIRQFRLASLRAEIEPKLSSQYESAEFEEALEQYVGFQELLDEAGGARDDELWRKVKRYRGAPPALDFALKVGLAFIGPALYVIWVLVRSVVWAFKTVRS